MMINKKYPVFDDWSEAFDHCRMRDVPTRVIIEEGNTREVWVLFPSGHAEFIRGIIKGDE